MRQHTITTPYLVGDVHYYTAEINGESILFDTGPPTPEALHHLRSEVNIKKLSYVFITHCHADHYGLVDHLSHHTIATILLPRRDVLKFTHHQRRMEVMQQLIREQGFDERHVNLFRQVIENNMVTPKLPARYEIAEESKIPASLGIEVIPCPGHSQSDLVYLCGDDVVSGDVLLHNVFQIPLLDADLDTLAGRFDNYGAYCQTLLQLPRLAGKRIHPGHRGSVDGVEATIVWYVRKMLERARRMRALSHTDGIDLMQIVHRLFGETFGDIFVVYLKVSEIMFLRDFLADPDLLRNSLARIGLLDEVRETFEALTG